MITDAVKKGINMIEFINVLFDPDNEFLRLALYIGLLSSPAFGIIGTYVVTRKISYLAGAISHCVFGGIGAGLFIRNYIGLTWFDPMYGAILAAILAAVVIGVVSLYAKQREDTIIGTLWAVGMAAGLLFIDMTPGYFDITSYLFGDILIASYNDIWFIIILDIVIAGISIYFYNNLMAVCFDPEFARLRGINTHAHFILLLCLTALTVVLLVRIVGIILVIALLTIPAAIAGQFARRLWHMMLLSIFLSLCFTWTGLAFSYTLNFSSGPTIIVISGITYVLILIGTQIWKKVKHR